MWHGSDAEPLAELMTLISTAFEKKKKKKEEEEEQEEEMKKKEKVYAIRHHDGSLYTQKQPEQ